MAFCNDDAPSDMSLGVKARPCTAPPTCACICIRHRSNIAQIMSMLSLSHGGHYAEPGPYNVRSKASVRGHSYNRCHEFPQAFMHASEFATDFL